MKFEIAPVIGKGYNSRCLYLSICVDCLTTARGVRELVRLKSAWLCPLINIIVWEHGLSFIIMFPDLAKLSRAMPL